MGSTYQPVFRAMSKTYPYPIDHNPNFNPKGDSMLIRILRAILSKLSKPKV
jgi:hypothetical protein